MSDSLPGAMPDSAERVGPATARLVLALDTAITAFRAGMSTGLPALDAASRALTDVTDDLYARAGARAHVPARPDRIELAILTALADIYGGELLAVDDALGYALRLLARHGGVRLVQRVLLVEARAALTQISLAFPDAFLAEANAVIAGFRPGPRPRPPGDLNSPKGGHD